MKFKLSPYNLQELGQRQNQEDSLFPGIGKQTANDRLFILCDGMGGHEKGEVASATVCETISNTILSRWNPNEPLSDDLLLQAIDDAYDALDAKDNGEAKKMGTTMTFLCFHAAGVTVAHIGDSRVYQLRRKRPSMGGDGGGYIVFKTQDHSLVNDLIKIGEITEEEAKHHPQKNVITRAMQPCQERRSKADIKHLTDVQPGDYFFMCSDGMLEQTTDDNLLNIITNPKRTDKEKLETLRMVTDDNKDNHTAHLIRIDKVGTASANTKRKPILPILIAAILIAILAVAATFFMKSSDSEGNEDEKVEKVDSVKETKRKEIHHKVTPTSVKKTDNDSVKDKKDNPAASQEPSKDKPTPETSNSAEAPTREQPHRPSAKDVVKTIEQLNKEQNKK